MGNISKQQLQKSMEGFRLPTYLEIPNVGLYLEQTSKYIMDYLEVLPGVTLTGSMISNYVKKKMIPNPKKKMYDREQIAYLFFIAIAKSVLALEDVQLLMEIQKKNCSSEDAYALFCQELTSSLAAVFEGASSGDDENPEEKQEREVLRKMTAVVAHKVYMDKYLEMIRAEGEE